MLVTLTFLQTDAKLRGTQFRRNTHSPTHTHGVDLDPESLISYFIDAHKEIQHAISQTGGKCGNISGLVGG